MDAPLLILLEKLPVYNQKNAVNTQLKYCSNKKNTNNVN